MGISLYTYGAHQLDFKGKKFAQLAAEIKVLLDEAVFSEARFLKHEHEGWRTFQQKVEDEIPSKFTWEYRKENEYYSFDTENYIHFYGPYGLELSFNENFLIILNPDSKYSHWFEGDASYRDPWRKYFKEVLHIFAGKKAVYLGDSGSHLTLFMEFKGSFAEMEAALFEKFGPAKSSFIEVYDDILEAYFIDDFKDLD